MYVFLLPYYIAKDIFSYYSMQGSSAIVGDAT